MKRELALRYAAEIHRRLASVNGRLLTPGADWEAFQFHRVWVFGSTIKDAANPNDLDLLIDASPTGQRFTIRDAGVVIDKSYLRRSGIALPISARKEALKWISKGMRKVSRHMLDDEEAEIDRKIEIYPRFDLG